MADVAYMDPDTTFMQLIARVVESAAYAAECSVAAFLAVQADGSARVQASFGGEFASLDAIQYAALLGAMDCMEGQSEILFGGPGGGPSFGLGFLDAARDRAPRFFAVTKIRNQVQEVIGLLAVADEAPRDGLSPAKTYVFLSQALQIADAWALRLANQRPAATNAAQN